MTYQMKNVNELQEGSNLLLVTDQMTKDMYFQDSEVTGWALVDGKLYEAYRRYWADDKEIPELAININDPLVVTSKLLEGIERESAFTNNPYFYENAKALLPVAD